MILSSGMSSLTIGGCQSCGAGSATCRRALSAMFSQKVVWTLVLALMFSAQICSHAAQPPVLKPDDLKTFQSDVTSKPYFRHLQIDDDKIYVGGKDYVYRLNPDDIEKGHDTSAKLEVPGYDSKYATCSNQRQEGEDAEFLCNNHITTIVRDEQNDEIYVCGTGVYNSQDFRLFDDDLSIKETMIPSTGLGRCPYDPRHNFTAINIEQGNPLDKPVLYTGTILSPVNPYPVIFRPQYDGDSGEAPQNLVRTDFRDANWLKEPNFVASHETEKYVFFWFREEAVENVHCGGAIFSRIARVCKKDQGGPIGFTHEWCTFVKVKLECALPGDSKFYFDEIQDVFQIDSSGDTWFYAVFTSNINGVYGSAVCAFDQTSIDSAFDDGTFKDQEDAMSFWTRVPENTIPSPRPGSCVDDSRHIEEEVLNFIRAKPIMYDAVQPKLRNVDPQPEHQEPLFYSSDVIFLRVAVDLVSSDYTVLFLGTDSGSVYKVVQWYDETDQKVKNRVLVIWEPFNVKEPIRQLKFIAESGMLYVSTDNEIKQFHAGTEQCANYDKCDQCIPDPYCRWSGSREKCVVDSSRPRGVTDLEDLTDECGSDCKSATRVNTIDVKMQGRDEYLVCQSHCTMEQGITWYKDDIPVSLTNSNEFILTQEHGLLVRNITSGDAGRYECKLNPSNIVLAEHVIGVTVCTDERCLWETEFNHWCEEFDTYKTQFNEWQTAKDQCQSDTGNPDS